MERGMKDANIEHLLLSGIFFSDLGPCRGNRITMSCTAIESHVAPSATPGIVVRGCSLYEYH